MPGGYDIEGDVKKEIGPFGNFILSLIGASSPEGNFFARNIYGAQRQNLLDAYGIGYEGGEVPEEVVPGTSLLGNSRAISGGERGYAEAGAARYRRAALEGRTGDLRRRKLAAELFDKYGDLNPEVPQYYIDYYTQGGEEFIPKAIREGRQDTRTGAKDLKDMINSLGPDAAAFIGKFKGYEDILQNSPEVFSGMSVANKRASDADIAERRLSGEGGSEDKSLEKTTKFYAGIIAKLGKEYRDVVSGKEQIEGDSDDPVTEDISQLQSKSALDQPLTPRQQRALDLYTARKWAENKYAINMKAIQDGFTTPEQVQISGDDPTDIPDNNDPFINPFAARIRENQQRYFEEIMRNQGRDPAPNRSPGMPQQQGLYPVPEATPFPQLQQGPDLENLWSRDFRGR